MEKFPRPDISLKTLLMLAAFCAPVVGSISFGIPGNALAQQATVGSPHGQGSGGTTGGTAGSRGQGTGGSTAGARSGAGSGPSGSTVSNGPGPVNQNQFGGAFPTTPTPTDPQTTSGSTTVMTILNGTEASDITFPGRCGTHPLTGMSPRDRMSGQNLEFLKAAQAYVAPGYNPGPDESGLHLLGDYQETLESTHPDAQLAGLYLRLASSRPITPDMVTRVNTILCVSASSNLVKSITSNARSDGK